MNRFLVALACLFLSADAFAGGPPGKATGPVQTVEVPDVLGPVTTINAICPSPGAGCAAGQFASIKVAGRNTVSAQIVTSNFTGTFTAYISSDGGVNWAATELRNFLALPGIPAPAGSFSANTGTVQWSILIPYGGYTDVMLASTAAVTNTATVQLLASNSTPNLGLWATVRGSQPANGAGISTQDLKDGGRSYVVFSADGVTPAIAETVITFSKTVADTQTTGQTSYTITSAKTLRIQAICVSATMGAAANRVRVALRLNTGGACVAGSNILFPVLELAPNYGTATAAEGGASGCLPIPDGFEIAGNGTKAICLSEAATAASGTLSVNLIGFEY